MTDDERGPERPARSVERPAADAVDTAGQPGVRSPAKLVRLTLTIRNTLDEVHTVELDDRAVERLRELHDRTVASLKELLSPDLRTEFEEDVELPPPPAGDTQAELQVAQARLMGWLEGLFQGLRATALDRHLSSRLSHDEQEPEPEGEAGYL